MYILNLNNVDDSNIKYEKKLHPDGQVHIKIDEKFLDIVLAEKQEVQIVSHFDTYKDLFWILGAQDVLWANRIKEVHLVISSVLGQRSDRRFSAGESFDLKIIVKQLVSGNFSSITVSHPHSDVLPALIDALGTPVTVINNTWLVANVIKDIETKLSKEVVLVSPDAGAYKLVGKIGEQLKRSVVPANKIRDEEGNAHVLIQGNVKGKVCLIVDDICDGGRTFIGLADRLVTAGAEKVFLCVSHGLFTFGYEALMEDIQHIYTTDSIDRAATSYGRKFPEHASFVTRYELQ
jgi:ribose-phosphate pyrophosphokinase